MTIDNAFNSLVYFLTERFHSITIHVPNKTLIISTIRLNSDLYIELTANKSFVVRRYVNGLWDGSEGQCPTVKALQDCLIAMGAAQIPHAKCYL